MFDVTLRLTDMGFKYIFFNINRNLRAWLVCGYIGEWGMGEGRWVRIKGETE